MIRYTRLYLGEIMQIPSTTPFTVTQDLVERYEKKVAQKKKLPNLERVLKQSPHMQFAPENGLYGRFLKMLSKVEFSDEKLYVNTLKLFRSRFGLEVDYFEKDAQLISTDGKTVVSCS